MKKVITIVITFLLLAVCTVFVSAHPGRTDSKGGHYDRSTGEYHYHSGEYAGRNQSSNSYSDKTYNSYTSDIWQKRGLEDGIKQLCEDTIYKNSYTKGFNDASEEYFKIRPIFKIIFEEDKHHIFEISFNSFDSKFFDVKRANYQKYISSSYNDLYKNFKNYSNSYDYSYKHGSYINAPSDYKESVTVIEIKENAYQEGYDYFYNSCLNEYKENYPIEAFFTTLHLIPILYILFALVSFIAIILFLRWVNKSKHTKITIVEECTPTDEVTVEVIPAEPPMPKEENKEIKAPKQPQYVSLIPQFVPPDSKSKTETKHNNDIPIPYPYRYEKYKEKTYLIGSDIPCGTYFFTPKHFGTPAFFASNNRTTNITRPKQRFYLVNGERIFLFNCYLEPEE